MNELTLWKKRKQKTTRQRVKNICHTGYGFQDSSLRKMLVSEASSSE